MHVITAEDLRDKLLTESVSVFLLDVREKAEIEAAPMRADNVHCIPMGAVKEQLNDIPTDKTIVVICRSGARSGMVVEYLLEQGYTDALNLIGGVMAWEQPCS